MADHHAVGDQQKIAALVNLHDRNYPPVTAIVFFHNQNIFQEILIDCELVCDLFVLGALREKDLVSRVSAGRRVMHPVLTLLHVGCTNYSRQVRLRLHNQIFGWG